MVIRGLAYLAAVVALASCGAESGGYACGPGTTPRGDACVPADGDGDSDADGDIDADADADGDADELDCEGVVRGDVQLLAPGDIAAYRTTARIQGSLFVDGNSELIVDLPCLEEITGHFNIGAMSNVIPVARCDGVNVTRLSCCGGPTTNVEEVYLPRLTSVGWTLMIASPLRVFEVGGLAPGQELQVGGDFTVVGTQLESMGAGSVTGLDPHFDYCGDSEAASRFVFLENDRLTSLPNLAVEEIFMLRLVSNPTLADISGLTGLAGIGDVEVRRNPNLPTCAVDSVLEQLETVPSSVWVEDTDDTADCP